jgi:hypothetical protein
MRRGAFGQFCAACPARHPAGPTLARTLARMSISTITLGSVFQGDWSQDPVRVIAFDAHVVMYDTWWSHRGAWGMSKLLGNYSYYRLQRSYFEEHVSFLRADPLSEKEALVHRPDLPFAFGVRQSLSWYEMWPNSVSEENEVTLDAPAIYLAPFGPRDSSKPAVLVQATNGLSFSQAELLVAAKSIQEPHIRDLRLTSGVGIYRSGIQKRLPSYYLWGSKSRLDV